MGRLYYISGRSGATAATAQHCAVQLWNPSSTRFLRVKEIWGVKTAAVADNHALIKTTARGTPASSLVATAANCVTGDPVSPRSAFELDLGAFSVQPTLSGTIFLARSNLAASIGASFVWAFDGGIVINPLVGLAVVVPTGLSVAIQATDFTFVVSESD